MNESVKAANSAAPGDNVVVEYNVPAHMRDGTVLYANVFKPAGEGPWPVLLTRVPYGKDTVLPYVVMDPLQVARSGFLVVFQDARGCFKSEGEFVPFKHEWEDGFDTVEWAAKLPGANGRVVMFGASYFGNTQWSAAIQLEHGLGGACANAQRHRTGQSYPWHRSQRGICIRLACSAFGISKFCYRYRPKLDVENTEIVSRLIRLTHNQCNWGFGLCFPYLRNVKGFGWNHQRACRIYRELE